MTASIMVEDEPKNLSDESKNKLVEIIFEKVREKLREHAHVPTATYRLQFNNEFTFKQAQAIVEYFKRLGISDLYASPYFRARPGSMHGYDIANHNEINPEIGSREEYESLVEELHRQ